MANKLSSWELAGNSIQDFLMLNLCWLIGAHSIIGHCTLSGQIIHSNKFSKTFLIMINECFSETEFLNKMNNNKKLLLVSSRGSQKDWYLNIVEFSKLGIFIYKQFCWTYIKNGSEVKASARNAGDLGLIPGSGRSPGEGNGNPLQYSCLENSMDRGAWRATVYGVAKSRTRLGDFTLLHFIWKIAMQVKYVYFDLKVNVYVLEMRKDV